MLPFLALHPGITAAAVAGSLLLLLGSIALTPWVVTRLPEDYFSRPSHRPLEGFQDRPVLRIFLLILKNLTGGLLLLAGVSMLVLPGQGLLTIAIALLVLDFPGKYRLKQRMIEIPGIRDRINRYRTRHNRPPFI